MRKATVIFAVVLAIAGVAVAVAAATGKFGDSNKSDPVRKYVAPAGRPSLSATGSDPLRLRGTGFAPGEHVRIAVKGGRSIRSRAVTAGARGRFVTTLPGVTSCASVNVVAVGDKGSRAAFNLSSYVCTE